jgi:hypothetical protein
MGCSTSIPQTVWWEQEVNSIYGAWCMFINDTHTLAGIHTPRRNHQVRICGFGGKAEANESWWATAFRETIEEFFHVTTIPNNLFHALKRIHPVQILQQEDPRYITLVYTFTQLKQFLKICSKYITSPLYQRMPETVEQLIFRRNVGNLEGVEIMDIIAWPLKNPHRRFRITREFIGDMRRLMRTVQQPGLGCEAAQPPFLRV